MPATTSFWTLVQARELEHVRAHDQVRVPVAARVRPVGADPADLGRQVEDDFGPRLLEQPLGVVPAGQVELGAARHHHLVAALTEPLDQERAEEAGRRP